MRPEELEAVCREAARGLLEREGRPVPPAVVLPLPEATRVHRLPELPEGDEARTAYLARFADEIVRPVNAPCYGFLAEAEADGHDVLVVVWGARGHQPQVSAAALDDDAMGEWLAAEPLDPRALPFLAPLQQAVDQADPARPTGTGLPGWPGG